MPWIVKINWLCLFIGIPYLASMLIFPLMQGNWKHVHSVWYTWQSFNTGVLAFTASIFALNAVRYTEEKKRQRNFVAARAFLPQALSELTTYFEKSSKLMVEAWSRAKDNSDWCKTPLNSECPELPSSYRQVFKDCISEAYPEVADHFAYILVRLQIHHSRMKSLVRDFSEDNNTVQIPYSLMTQVFALAELQALINQLFEFSRGMGSFDNKPLSEDDFYTCYRLWSIEIDKNIELKSFTERNHGKRWSKYQLPPKRALGNRLTTNCSRLWRMLFRSKESDFYMNVEHFKDAKYWLKGITIILWSLYLSIYIWIFSYLMNSPAHLDKFVSVAVSVLVGSIGFSYISNIYNFPFKEFNIRNFYAALSIFVIFACLAWTLWVYKLANGSNEPEITKYFAGLVVFYIVSIFVAPTYILSAIKTHKNT